MAKLAAGKHDLERQVWPEPEVGVTPARASQDQVLDALPAYLQRRQEIYAPSQEPVDFNPATNPVRLALPDMVWNTYVVVKYY